MPTGLYALVDAPAAPTPRGPTLLRSANLVDDVIIEPDGVTRRNPRWMQGLTWRPRACGSSAIVAGVDVCATFSGFSEQSEGTAPQYVPPHVAVALPCSGISGGPVLAETRDRAVALLDRCQTLGIADELWTADVAVARGWPNPSLSDPTGLEQLGAGAATAVLDAMAALEEGAAQNSCAGGGVIHATVQTVTYWKHLQLLERQADGRLLTALGTVVIADPGYDGSAPDGSVDASGATAWAYGTTMIDIRLGPVEISTGPNPNLDLSGLDRRDNDFVVYAHRAFAATFDPCTRVGVKVNHAVLT